MALRPLPLFIFCFLPLFLTSSARSSCSNSSTISNAVYSSHLNYRGACGYEEYGATVNGGFVTGVNRLYNVGRGCGACYHIRCTDARYCKAKGVTVVVTDLGFAKAGVDFVLSQVAFAQLAKPYFSDHLLDMGLVQVEYRRVPCEYPRCNLTIKVLEQSVKPTYLSFVFLCQDGKYDILDVQVASSIDECEEWMPMRRSYGTVWDLEDTPKGPLAVKLLLISDNEYLKWVNLGVVIPETWSPYKLYNTGMKLSTIGRADLAQPSLRSS